MSKETSILTRFLFLSFLSVTLYLEILLNKMELCRASHSMKVGRINVKLKISVDRLRYDPYNTKI